VLRGAFHQPYNSVATTVTFGHRSVKYKIKWDLLPAAQQTYDAGTAIHRRKYIVLVLKVEYTPYRKMPQINEL
jgi:hypothetical protein